MIQPELVSAPYPGAPPPAVIRTRIRARIIRITATGPAVRGVIPITARKQAWGT